MSHVDPSTDAILARLEAMQATLDAQQAAIGALQQENARLHAALSVEQPATLNLATPLAREVAHGEVADAAEEPDTQTQPRAGLTSRRGLLRGAAAATAAATVGVAALGVTEPTHAAPLANGGNLIIGQSNTATSMTTLASSTNPQIATFQAFTSTTEYHSSAINGVSQDGASGVIGADYATNPNSRGVGEYGWTLGSSGTGVLGETQATGIGVYGVQRGEPGPGIGVMGESPDGMGVHGFSNSGWGVVGESVASYDILANNSGIVGVQVQTYVGAPTTGSFTIGDSIRDANGDLWPCTAGDGMSVGTWAKVMTLAPGGATGGIITYLSKPIRLLDTRKGQSAANTPGASYLVGSTHTIQVAGVSYNSVSVPARCSGAIGNLTVIGQVGSGNFVALVPSGAGFSGTANIAFTAGQVVSNAYNVGLSATGKLDIILGGGGTSSADVILDLFAIVSLARRSFHGGEFDVR